MPQPLPAPEPIQYAIDSYDPDTRQVSVTFVYAGVTHTRFVNAVMSPSGAYDEHGTELRIVEVARGVEHKIDLGVIQNLPEPVESPEPDDDEVGED